VGRRAIRGSSGGGPRIAVARNRDRRAARLGLCVRVATIVGARPQFIKAAPVSQALDRAGHEELVIHTGQHYDDAMSDVFFRELPIAEPRVNLSVGSGAPGWQVAEVLTGVERALAELAPDVVLVYGDTNSTLGGALAARKACIPLAHVEAGLRSFNRNMPEEENRVLTDHASDLLLCPTPTAMTNLRSEGLAGRAVHVGDTMYDAVRAFLPVAQSKSTILEDLGLASGGFYLATIHRNYNTDDPDALRRLVETLASLEHPVVFPAHPRTRARLEEQGGAAASGERLRLIDPVSYLDMLVLQAEAALVLTDSGGMQKEALFVATPCVTLRPETEWVETVEAGWNRLAGSDPQGIRDAIAAVEVAPRSAVDVFGNGDAASRIVEELARLET
jgi:UDP-N-acetylglucosamine 2-epimerase